MKISAWSLYLQQGYLVLRELHCQVHLIAVYRPLTNRPLPKVARKWNLLLLIIVYLKRLHILHLERQYFCLSPKKTHRHKEKNTCKYATIAFQSRKKGDTHTRQAQHYEQNRYLYTGLNRLSYHLLMTYLMIINKD